MLKKKTGIKKDRRGRMGIVTNTMSDEVYSYLQQKAKRNELSKYIIKLVEMDMQKDLLQDQLTSTQRKLEEFNDSLLNMKYNLEILQKQHENKLLS